MINGNSLSPKLVTTMLKLLLIQYLNNVKEQSTTKQTMRRQLTAS